MNTATIVYQVSALAITSPIITIMPHNGIVSVIAVANTLVNRTIALGLVRVTRKPKMSGLPLFFTAVSSMLTAVGLVRMSFRPR